MPLVKIIDPILRGLRFNGSEPKKTIYASSLGACPRRFAWEKTLGPEEFGFEQKRIFDVGNDFHNRYAEYLAAAGVLSGSEISVNDDQRGVRGRLDNIIEVDSKRYVVEFKTAAASSYNTIIKTPKKNHKLQCGYYMQQTGINDGLVVYLIKELIIEKDGVDKVKFPIIEHHIKMSQKLSDEVDKSINRLKDALNLLESGEITHDIDKSECSFCTFNQVCEYSYKNSDNRPTSLMQLFQNKVSKSKSPPNEFDDI